MDPRENILKEVQLLNDTELYHFLKYAQPADVMEILSTENKSLSEARRKSFYRALTRRPTETYNDLTVFAYVLPDLSCKEGLEILSQYDTKDLYPMYFESSFEYFLFTQKILSERYPDLSRMEHRVRDKLTSISRRFLFQTIKEKWMRSLRFILTNLSFRFVKNIGVFDIKHLDTLIMGCVKALEEFQTKSLKLYSKLDNEQKTFDEVLKDSLELLKKKRSLYEFLKQIIISERDPQIFMKVVKSLIKVDEMFATRLFNDPDIKKNLIEDLSLSIDPEEREKEAEKRVEYVDWKREMLSRNKDLPKKVPETKEREIKMTEKEKIEEILEKEWNMAERLYNLEIERYPNPLEALFALFNE